jgi:hypothetical protein
MNAHVSNGHNPRPNPPTTSAFNALFPQLTLFPLHAVVQTDDGPQCGCGSPCKRIGKHPATLWNAEALHAGEKIQGATGSYGVATGERSGVFVIETDSAEAEAWIVSKGVPATLTVLSGSGRGYHRYFQWPGFKVWGSNSVIQKHVDLKGDGQYVVAPCSKHKSGGTYTITSDLPVAEAPTWLLDWLREYDASHTGGTSSGTSGGTSGGTTRGVPAPAQTFDGDVTDTAERDHRRSRYTKWLATAPAAVEGRGGDAALFAVVQHGAYDLALPVEDVLECIREVYDPRCQPPWGDELNERVTHKCDQAKTRSTRARWVPLSKAEKDILEWGGWNWHWDDDTGPANDAAPANVKPPTNERPVPRFTIVSAAELATPVPPVSYVLKHFGIAPGRPSLLAGYGGTGKTIIVQCLAMHMAAGVPSCWGRPIATGGVIHIDYEMTINPIRRRYQRLAWGHEVDLSKCDLGCISMPLLYLSDREAERALVEACSGKILCIVDNLAAATATAEAKENESGIRKHLDVLTRVSAATGCTFFVLVHERKSSKEDPGGLQRVRGSSGITDASGSVVSISAAEGDGIVTVVQTKTSHRKKGESINLKIEDCGEMRDDSDDPEGLRVVVVAERPLDEQNKKLENEIVRLLSKGPQATKKDIEARIGGRKGRVGPVVDAMVVRRGVIFLKGQGYVLDYPDARERRVVNAVDGTDMHRSPAQIAKAAHVDTEVVTDMIFRGLVHKDSTGRYWTSAAKRDEADEAERLAAIRDSQDD